MLQFTTERLNWTGLMDYALFCLTDYAKTFDCVDHNKLENS